MSEKRTVRVAGETGRNRRPLVEMLLEHGAPVRVACLRVRDAHIIHPPVVTLDPLISDASWGSASETVQKTDRSLAPGGMMWPIGQTLHRFDKIWNRACERGYAPLRLREASGLTSMMLAARAEQPQTDDIVVDLGAPTSPGLERRMLEMACGLSSRVKH